ncbi:cilia- and flagella-associated protein 46 isoform X5 [Ascaphus truei]|uniref:cilia- and flagella-associated protein 46 isoform X5 n=1 Tax=Ascaphus truei TaxID=8439 RepID=UPI003F59534E
MDMTIRQHLSAAENQQDADALLNAYKLIQDANTDRSVDVPENFSCDLYILCAEQAIQVGNQSVSRDCLQMYFKSNPPTNQFFGRAYLCEAQLHVPQSANNVDELKRSVAFYLKAIEFAKQQQRYYFLVSNASVLYWQTVRPFLKSGSRHHLIPSLTRVVQALDFIDEQDRAWKAELMMELLECMLDAQKIEAAADFASVTAEYVKAEVPEKYHLLFSKMVHHKLIDLDKAAMETKASMRLSVIYEIQKLRSQMDNNLPTKDIFTNLNDIYKLLTTCEEEETSSNISIPEKIPLLIELACLSMELKCNQLVASCINDLKNTYVSDPATLIIVECLECEHEVQNLGTKAALYTKSAVEAQLKVIRRLESALQNAIRLSDANTIQVVCTTMWNLCLPLLQHNLRKHLRKPLIFISETLETIDSLLILQRCQVHMEVAQIEEDDDRIEVALEHIQKALLLDDNGQYQNTLKVHRHRLQLRATLYKKPVDLEDQAAMLIEQAKQSNSKDTVRQKRSLLVNAGLCLAPNTFQMVVDSENEAKVSTGKSNKGNISYLCAKAQHHTKCVQKTGAYLKRMEDKNDSERVRLWTDLAKVARKQEVWDVCRTACRYCLLYDDGRWKIPKHDVLQKKKSLADEMDDGKSLGLELESSTAVMTSFNYERTLLRTLAEIRFINAEATIHLLKSEGCKLNERPVPLEDTSIHPMGYIAKNLEEDQEWIAYSDWVSQLSQYATENFLRAAELGIELDEAWITHNAAVYLLNHNKHVIAAGRQSELTVTLQKLLTALKQTGHNGNAVLLVMLSNALANGLIHRWIPVSAASKRAEISPKAEKGKRARGKGSEKSNLAHVLSIDPNGLPDVKLALEVCEYALELTNGKVPEEVVPISVRHQIISTWVKAKQLHHQQIGHKLGTDDEDNNEGQNPMTKVLVALEMHSCNGIGLMDFTVPSLSQVFKMTSECIWSDSLVELQTLAQLTNFAYHAHNHELVLTCSQKALQLDEKTNAKKRNTRNYTLEQEMLSIAACIQGQSIIDNFAGNKHLYLSAIKAFQLSARFAGEARSIMLTSQAADHFWHACSPRIKSAEERKELKDATISILRAITDAESKSKQGPENDVIYLHPWPIMDVQLRGEDDAECPKDKSSVPDSSNKGHKLRALLYELLFNTYADNKDWESGLKVLDEAIRILPRTKHRLIIFKHRVLVKARLGYNFFMDIQKFKNEGEDYLSYMWHQVALTTTNTREQLACYMNAIDALQKPENDWQKVEYLMELAEWLYCNQFPVNDSLNQLDWAVDILLQMKLSLYMEEDKSQKGKSKSRNKSWAHKDQRREGVHAEEAKSENRAHLASSYKSMEDIRNVRQLETLARAHTLMAIICGHSSPNHEQHCLMAYAYIIRIWQVSLPAAGSFIKALPKILPPPEKPPSAASKKEKGKKEATEASLPAAGSVRKASPKIHPPPQNPHSAKSQKERGKKEAKEPTVIKEKPKRKGPIDVLPSNVEEWASYDCPDEVRDAFKLDKSCYAINQHTIVKPTYSLYYLDLLIKELQSISFTHLILPVLHLAEVIAHNAVESKSLSDLYHLRISQACADLKLYPAATYHERTVGNVFISEHEQISCRQEMFLNKDKKMDEPHLEQNNNHQLVNRKPKILSLHAAGKGLSGLSLPYLWLDKADVLIQLGFFQPARHLLSEAYSSLREIGDKYDILKCLYLLSVLANSEKNHGQARELLMEVQQIERDAEFWYKTTMSLTDAVLGENKEGKEKKACKILETTLNVFQSMLQKQTNRESECGFFIASLHARKLSILAQTFQNLSNKGIASSQLTVMLLEICDKMSQIENDLLRYGYKEYSTDIMMEHAHVLRYLAKIAEDEECKHSYYLDSYLMAQRAISIQEQLLYNIQSLLSLNEAGNINLPVMRTLAKKKLDLIEIALEILPLVSTEGSKTIQAEKRKGSLCKAVEAFVGSTPDYNSIEQEWKTLQRSLGTTVLSQLASLQTLTVGCNDLKARCLYLTGKCLYLLSVEVDPLSPDMYWNEDFLDEIRKSKAREDKDSKCPTSGDVQLTNKQQDHLTKKAIELKSKRTVAQNYLAQASEILLQSINAAISNNLMSILSAASLQMCSCLGQFDPILTGLFLALHQSCSASMMIKDIVSAATYNTSNSQFAALLHHHQLLQEKGDSMSGLFKSIMHKLCETSTVWENLLINMQHFNIIHELPPNFNIIILQHSEDRSFLYGAVLEKSKVNSAQKGKLNQQQKGMQAKAVRCAVDHQMFSYLLERMELFKQDTMRILKRKCRQSCNNREQDGCERNQEVTQDSGLKKSENAEDENEKNLSSAFHEVVDAMETYLNPVLLKLDFSSLRQPSSLLLTAEPGRAKSREKEEKPMAASGASTDMGECIILLADKLLMELPLEALGVLKEEGISSVSRDFSLQLLYNRVHREQTEESEVKRDTKSAKEPKPKVNQKKNIKVAPINRTLPPNCISVQTHFFKYIVDPYDEAREPEAVSPVVKMHEVLGKYNQQFTPLWEGIMGSLHVPSYGEWENLMNNCSAFLFYGTERFLAHILLDRFVAMNFTECQLMILLDLVQTNRSFLRQTRVDVQKSEACLALERPVETALLLSVTGVRSIMLNQWHTTLEQNAKRLNFLAENLLELGKTTGQTIHIQRKIEAEHMSSKVGDPNHSEDAHEEVFVSPCHSKVSACNPSFFNYVLYGLPNMIVM